MKKILLAFFMAASIVSLAGCFDITEDVTINKDGSGKYVNTIDATKLAEQMKMFAAFDSTGEMIPKLKYSLDSSFASTWDAYKSIKDITNIKIDTSKEYVYTVALDFKNIAALNAALSKDKSANQQNMYTWEKGKISRQDMPLNLSDLKTEDEQQKEMMKGFLKDMTYKIIFHLPNSVKKVSNKSATISQDKKTVTLEANLLDVTEDKVKLGTEVTYK